MPGRDVVALTEAVVTNRDYQRRFSELADAGDEHALGAFMGPIVMDLVNASQTALTQAGRQVKMTQCVEVVRRLGPKAAAAEALDVEGAAEQANWCRGLFGFLDGMGIAT